LPYLAFRLCQMCMAITLTWKGWQLTHVCEGWRENFEQLFLIIFIFFHCNTIVKILIGSALIFSYLLFMKRQSLQCKFIFLILFNYEKLSRSFKRKMNFFHPFSPFWDLLLFFSSYSVLSIRLRCLNIFYVLLQKIKR
jgi:hypothetical protein